MPVKARELAAALAAKGFEVTEGDHTWFVYRSLDGRKTRARTKLSHGAGGRDIPEAILGPMARQLRLTRSQLELLVACPLGRVEYDQVLRDQGEL